MKNEMIDDRIRMQKRFFAIFSETLVIDNEPRPVFAVLAFATKCERDELATRCDALSCVNRDQVLHILGRYNVIDGICVSSRKRSNKFDDLADGYIAKLILLQDQNRPKADVVNSFITHYDRRPKVQEQQSNDNLKAILKHYDSFVARQEAMITTLKARAYWDEITC